MVTTNPTSRVAVIDSIGTRAEAGDNSLAALKRAQLDFDVDLIAAKNPVTGEVITEGKDKDGNPLGKYFFTVRRDTKQVLGVVEGRYTVIPNREVFDIADAMVEEDGAMITRAGALNGGARCFMNLDWPNQKNISVLGDIVSRRCILATSHDGKYSTIVRLTPMRLACLNGMVIPVPCFSFEYRIKHTESASDRLNEARGVMAGASQYFETFGAVARRMAEIKVTTANAERLLKAIPDIGKDTTASNKKREEIIGLFEGGQANGNHEAIRGTSWGLFNAIAEFADHNGRIRLARGSGPAVQRFKSGFEGSSQRLKFNAYHTLVSDRELGLKEFVASLN